MITLKRGVRVMSVRKSATDFDGDGAPQSYRVSLSLRQGDDPKDWAHSFAFNRASYDDVKRIHEMVGLEDPFGSKGIPRFDLVLIVGRWIGVEEGDAIPLVPEGERDEAKRRLDHLGYDADRILDELDELRGLVGDYVQAERSNDVENLRARSNEAINRWKQ